MKFRYKVLTVNLVLLSLGLGVVGYLMIHRSFETVLNTQVKNAVVENNLVQSSIEYELLQLINSEGYHIKKELSDIGSRVAGSMLTSGSSFYIKYADAYVYSGDGEEAAISEALFDGLDVGGKNYLICEEDGRFEIYVTSYNRVNGEALCVISRSDISETYQLMDSQVKYFRIVITGILLAASAIMYMISMYLTRPMEKLNFVTDKMAEGHYDTRVNIVSGDEIGLLAAKFNHMGDAVMEHVDELNDMIHRRDQFVADFTHEIKTPMTAIIGYADTMRSMELSREEEIMSLDYIVSEGKRLEAMSAKLFELIYLKQHAIEKKPIHVTDMAKEIERIVTPALERKKIRLQSDFEPAVICGNRELLVTVFINLIDNARKASKEGDVIEFTGRILRQGEEQDRGAMCYEVSVTDYGIGMTEEDAKRMFDEFYMADKSRARREGGAGIGMSLVALIVERHGAELSVQSRIAEGTAIKIMFFDEGENAGKLGERTE